MRKFTLVSIYLFSIFVIFTGFDFMFKEEGKLWQESKKYDTGPAFFEPNKTFRHTSHAE